MDSFEGMNISYYGDNTILTGYLKDESTYAWDIKYHKGLTHKPLVYRYRRNNLKK